jgi:predicted CopG family antitoxin
MGAKTISLSEAAYDRLKRQRRGSGDSFSRIVMRARWKDEPITAGEFLDLWKEEPPFFSEAEIDEMAASERLQGEPIDRWSAP